MVSDVNSTVNRDTLSVGIVRSEFNQFVTDRLYDGAVTTLEQSGIPTSNINLYRVPGCFEIPGATKQVISERDHDGIICLGAVIRGETPHFDYICSHVTNGIGQLSLDQNIPVIFGVLTTDTSNQALARSSRSSGNKGREAAKSLLQTLDLYEAI